MAVTVTDSFTELADLLASAQLPTIIGGPRTFVADVTHAAATVKPDTTPLHFRTTPGANRENQTFSIMTNGGASFTSGGGTTLIDDIFQWGTNLPGPHYNPAYPSVYDSMEAGYILSDGSIRWEHNLNIFSAVVNGSQQWPVRRARGVSFDRTTGHINWIYSSDFYTFANTTGTFTPIILGAYPSLTPSPYGVWEVEATAAGSGYTDGTNYALGFSGGGGTGAAGRFDVVAGKVTNVQLDSSGWGYTTAPTVSFPGAGSGTGAVAAVLIGTTTFKMPTAFTQPTSAPRYLVTNAGQVLSYLLLGTTNSSSGAIYGGYNLTEVGGTYKNVITGATSGFSYGTVGRVDLFAAPSTTAGTAVLPAWSLLSTGEVLQVLASDAPVWNVTLPLAGQTNNIILVSKPDSTKVFQVTSAGWVGIGNITPAAPLDVVLSTTGDIALFGASGVKSLAGISYNKLGDSVTVFTGLMFGLTEIRSQSNNDVNLRPNGTGKIGLTGLIAITDAKNIAVGTATGTQIGTATAQKIGFWAATPVVQQVLATGASHTADDIITLLQTLGLCRQS